MLVCTVLLTAVATHAQARKQPARQAPDTEELESALGRAADAQAAGRYAQAAAAYAQATALDPNTAEIWANRGLMEYFARDFPGSEKSLSHAVSLKPSLFSPHFFLGLDELELGYPELALRHLDRAHAIEPADAQTASALGRAYVALGKPRLAAASYKAATNLAPDNDRAWYGLGAASIAVIEQDGETLSSRSSDSPWARALYADDLLAQGRTAEAIDIYRAIAKSSSPMERAILRATLQHTRDAPENGDEALPPSAWDSLLATLSPDSSQPLPSPTCNAAASEKPRTPAGNPTAPASNPAARAAAQHLRMACLFWARDLAAASAAAGDRLKSAPGDSEALFWSVKANEQEAVRALARFEQLAPRSAPTFDLLGDLYRRRARPDAALLEYKKALGIAPRDPDALLGQAASLLALGRADDAIAAAGIGLADRPDDPRLNMIGSEALVDRHRFSEAEPHLRSALRSIGSAPRPQPGYVALAARAHALLGRVEAETGNLDQAIAEMTLGLPSDTDGSLSFQLSRLYRRKGDPKQARAAEHRAQTLQARRREHAVTAVQGSADALPEVQP